MPRYRKREIYFGQVFDIFLKKKITMSFGGAPPPTFPSLSTDYLCDIDANANTWPRPAESNYWPVLLNWLNTHQNHLSSAFKKNWQIWYWICIYHYSLFVKFLETVSIRLFIVLLIIKSKETGNARSQQISRMKTKREIIILKFFLMWRLQCQDIVGKVQVDIFSSGLLTASCTLGLSEISKIV